jgi:non-ribosomal peptide synthetase component F
MMFNTGDIAQWSLDGSLETFGRADDQVKIKVSMSLPQLNAAKQFQGFRIELDGVTATIEVQIATHT